MIEDDDGLYFLLSLYAKLLSQLVGVYTSVLQELWLIRGEIAKLSRKLVSLYQRMDCANFTIEDIKMSLDLLKHRSVCISQKVDSRLEGPFRPAMDWKMDIPTYDYKPFKLSTNFNGHRLSSILPIPNHFPF